MSTCARTCPQYRPVTKQQFLQEKQQAGESVNIFIDKLNDLRHFSENMLHQLRHKNYSSLHI